VAVHHRLAWLQRLVLCLGFVGLVPTGSSAQPPISKEVEDARRKRVEAEHAEEKAILNERHRLELSDLELDKQIREEELKLEEKRKQRDENLRSRDPGTATSNSRSRKYRTGSAATRPTPVLKDDREVGLPPVEDDRKVSRPSRGSRSEGMHPGVHAETDDEDTEALDADEEDDDSTLVASGSTSQLSNAFLNRRVHVLLYANTNDMPSGGIGPGAKQNQVFLKSLFDSQFKGVLNQSVIMKETFDRTTLARDISQLKVGPTDAVFVYISTHGGFADNREHYLSKSGTNDASIRRNEIVAALRKKCGGKTNLRVLITDSCGSFIGKAPRIGIESKLDETYQLFRLMMTTVGEVNVNAAIPNTQALYFSQRSMSGGGIFTRSFVYMSVYGSLSENPTGKSQDWIPFFKQVSNFSQKSNSSQPAACWFDINGQTKRL
jgi:hypothetical protein